MNTKVSREERVKALHDRLVAAVEEIVSGEDWKADAGDPRTSGFGGCLTIRCVANAPVLVRCDVGVATVDSWQ